MTCKQIEASRELRLWIGQAIVPAITMSAVVLANPDVRRAAAEKIESVKQKIRSRKVKRPVTGALALLYFPHTGYRKVW